MADEELSADKKEQVKENLEWDMAIQRATQEINQHWENRIKKIKELHNHEMQNMVSGSRMSFSKPRLIDRLRGRYRDHYILFNNKIPVFCERKECSQRKNGVDYGVEAICLSREHALEAAEAYWAERKEYNGYSFNSLSIIHFQVDRFGSRQAMVVRNITIDQREWNDEKRSKVKKELDKVTAENLVLDSLMSARPKRKK